jgi:signal peptidase II
VKKKLFLATSLFLAGLDQATKVAAERFLSDLPEGQAVRLIRGVLYLKPTRNTGGVCGLGGHLPAWLFGGLSVLFVVYLAWLMLRLEERDRGYLPALALLLGGFLGNGIDRLRSGAVTDFVYITGYPPWLPSTFNVADLAILLGMVWLLIRYLSVRFRGARAGESSP